MVQKRPSVWTQDRDPALISQKWIFGKGWLQLCVCTIFGSAGTISMFKQVCDLLWSAACSPLILQCSVQCANVHMCAVSSVQTFCSESEAWLTREGWGLPEIGMTEAFFPENLEEGRFPHFGCFPPHTPPHLREIDPFARNPFPLWVIYASCYLPPGLPICSSSLWFRQQAAPVQSRGSKAHTGPRGGEGGRKWEVEEDGRRLQWETQLVSG